MDNKIKSVKCKLKGQKTKVLCWAGVAFCEEDSISVWMHLKKIKINWPSTDKDFIFLI